MRFFIVLLFLVQYQNAFGQEADRKLIPGQAGLVKVGMSAQDVYDRFPPDSVFLFDQFLEGTYSPALEIKGEGLVVELERDEVFRIKVNSGIYLTEAGLRVGGELGEILQHHPESELLRGEGNFVVYVHSLRMSFVLALDKLDPAKLDAFEYQQLSDLPKDTLIAQILILPKG